MSKVVDHRKKKSADEKESPAPAAIPEQRDNSIVIDVKINGINYNTNLDISTEDPSMSDIDKLCKGIKNIIKKATGKT